MELVEEREYTREQIHDLLGGELDTYLPQKDCRIVCGCFTEKLGPEAPETVLVGDAPKVVAKAQMLIEQGGTIPVFMKRAVNRWVFQGEYRLTGFSEDPKLIQARQREANRDDVVMVLYLEKADHATYLLTWNENRWDWSYLGDMIEETIAGKRPVDSWSVGRTKKIQPGDRLFLIRLGKTPRGIMGSGKALSGVEPGPHYRPERADRGDEALYVQVAFDHLLDPEQDELLSVDTFTTGPLASVHWYSQASGIEIKAGASELERLWQAHLAAVRPETDDPEMSAVEGKMRLMLIRHRSRERKLRDAKLDAHRRMHKGRLPCEACGFDFVETYGELGRDFAHVHHDRPLSELAKPAKTRSSDLKVVCPNCHAMIHRGGECRPVATLLVNRD